MFFDVNIAFFFPILRVAVRNCDQGNDDYICSQCCPRGQKCGLPTLAGPVTEELHLCVHACAYACRLAGKVNLGFQLEG